jgi:hypothetical protein
VTALRASGSGVLGLVADVFPGDAVAVREYHNIDTGFAWVCFQLPKGADQFRERLKQAGARRIDGPVSRGPKGRSWWPASMAQVAIEAYEVPIKPGAMSTRAGVDSSGTVACMCRAPVEAL